MRLVSVPFRHAPGGAVVWGPLGKGLRYLLRGGDPGSVELRVTCVCGTDVQAREALVRTLDSGNCAAVEFDDFEDVLMLGEFGDFLCTAVVVLDEDVDRRVASASRGLGAGKHVLVGPCACADQGQTLGGR